MMKAKLFKNRMLALLGMMALGGVISQAQISIDFTVAIVDVKHSTTGHGRVPAKTPTIWQDGYMLTFTSEHPEYAIDIIQDGVVVCSVNVEEDATSITLPSWLSGEYELQLLPEDSNYYYIGYITL